MSPPPWENSAPGPTTTRWSVRYRTTAPAPGTGPGRPLASGEQPRPRIPDEPDLRIHDATLASAVIRYLVVLGAVSLGVPGRGRRAPLRHDRLATGAGGRRRAVHRRPGPCPRRRPPARPGRVRVGGLRHSISGGLPC